MLFLSILQKLGHRLSALNNTNWSEQTKDEIKQVLTVDYTSSDESSYYEPKLQSQAFEIVYLLVFELGGDTPSMPFKWSVATAIVTFKH